MMTSREKIYFFICLSPFSYVLIELYQTLYGYGEVFFFCHRQRMECHIESNGIYVYTIYIPVSDRILFNVLILSRFVKNKEAMNIIIIKKGSVILNEIWKERFTERQADQIVKHRFGKIISNQIKIIMYSNR